MGTLQGQHIQKHDPTTISEYEFQAGLPKNNIRAFGCGKKIRLQDPNTTKAANEQNHAIIKPTRDNMKSLTPRTIDIPV